MVQRRTDEYKIIDLDEMRVDRQPELHVHPGVYLRDVVLPQHGLTNVVDLAARLKVNRPNLHEVLSGQREVSRELAYRLGALINDEVADFAIAYQHAWNLQHEQARRAELKREIARLEPAALK